MKNTRGKNNNQKVLRLSLQAAYSVCICWSFFVVVVVALSVRLYNVSINSLFYLFSFPAEEFLSIFAFLSFGIRIIISTLMILCHQIMMHCISLITEAQSYKWEKKIIWRKYVIFIAIDGSSHTHITSANRFIGFIFSFMHRYL